MNALLYHAGIDIGVVDAALDVLLLVREEVIAHAAAPDVVLSLQTFEAARDLCAQSNLIHAHVVRHEDDDVLEDGGHIV